MYNGLGTTQVPDDIKRAILIRTAPTEVRTHLQVNAGTIRTYQEMRDMIESFLRAKNVWKAKPGASVGGDPMEIGGIESKCSNCGKKGHDISQCLKKGGGAYDAYAKGKPLKRARAAKERAQIREVTRARARAKVKTLGARMPH